MLLRSLLGGLSLVLASPAVPQTIAPSAIPKVVCPLPGGYSMGSAVRVGTVLLSANHVTEYPGCMIDGHPIKVIHVGGDFSIISDGQAGPSLKIDCAGYIPGHRYVAIGHARGLDQLTVVDLVATGFKDGPLYVLKGIYTVIPGQSGGGIIDPDTGKLVGMVNTYRMDLGLSGSIELKGTAVCSA